MKNKSSRKKQIFKDCLKSFASPFYIYLVYTLFLFLIFWLYGLMLEPFVYLAIFVFAFLLIILFIKTVKEFKAAEIRRHHMDNILYEWKTMEESLELKQKDYHKMIETLGKQLESVTRDYGEAQRETQDFYTTWVHQIKTPIAVMKLELDKANSGELDRGALLEDLFRIEQYTDMVLAYQRLGSSSNDLLIKEYSLDELIREVIRKFAGQFIHKKLKLEYDGCQAKIIIDKKWFICILEQLLSNAIKYTNEGSVSIKLEDSSLSISDTGIGIAPEDLPRIFEKGYTGNNGRLGEKSSGLGLYLCSKAAKLLNLKIAVEANVGKGACFSIDLHEKLNF